MIFIAMPRGNAAAVLGAAGTADDQEDHFGNTDVHLQYLL